MVVCAFSAAALGPTSAIRSGWLTIHACAYRSKASRTRHFLARRQQHTAFEASTELELPHYLMFPRGSTAFQNENDWYFLGVRRHSPGSGPAAQSPAFDVFLENAAARRQKRLLSASLQEGTGTHQAQNFRQRSRVLVLF